MTMDWCRWHNGTVTDPKWRVIAKRAGVPLHMVIALWPALLEEANQSSERGTLESADAEDLAAALDIEPEQVAAIMEAMQGKVLDGKALTGWSKRNPKREREDNSTERVRRSRERNAMKRHETPSNALDKSREEKKEEDTGDKSPEAAPRKVEPEPEPAKPTAAEVHATIAPLIRKHFWLGNKAPGGVSMDRELSVAKQLVEKFSLEEVAGAIECAREALGIGELRRVTLLEFNQSGKMQKLHLAVAHWRDLKQREAAAQVAGMVQRIGNGGG